MNEVLAPAAVPATGAVGTAAEAQAAPADGAGVPPLGQRLVDAHLGSAFAGLTLVFVILRVLAVSRGNLTTALGIVAETGTTSVVAGTLIYAIGSILVVMLSLLMWQRVRPEEYDPSPRHLRWLALGLAIGWALVSPACFAPITLFVAWVAFDMPGTSGLMRRSAQRQADREWRPIREAEEALRDLPDTTHLTAETNALTAEIGALAAEVDTLGTGLPDPSPELLARLAALRARCGRLDGLFDEVALERARIVAASDANLIAGTAVLAANRMKLARKAVWARRLVFGSVIIATAFSLVILLVDTPWLPAERLVVTGQAPFTAYVLRADPDELVVLDAGSRRLVRIDGKALVSRRFCDPAGGDWLSDVTNSAAFRPLLTVYKAPPSYPRCSELGP